MAPAAPDHDAIARMLKALSPPTPPKGACATVPPNAYLDKAKVDSDKDGARAHALMSKDVWDYSSVQDGGRRIIKYAFIRSLGWSAKKQTAVLNTIKRENAKDFETWEHWAYITFEPADRLENSDIRIAFQPGPSWSCVGARAKYIQKDKPTLNLGWLKDDEKPDDDDRGTILHEFGHVLGMMHEHQSPARGEFIHLKELEVYKYYTPLLGDRATVKSQIIDTYNEGSIMNMSKLDLKSIMMYFMPGHLNEEGINVPVNTKLSKLDKAFIMMNYPPPLDHVDDKDREYSSLFMQAMIDAGVSNRAAGRILDAWRGDYELGDPDAQFASVFPKMRAEFSDFNKNAMRLRHANAALANSVNTAPLAQFGIMDFLGDVVNNKLFRSVVKSVVQSTLVQQGVPLKQTVPGANPTEVARMIAGLSMHPDVASYVTTYNNSLKEFAVTPRPVPQ